MGGIPAALNIQIYTLGAGIWLHTPPDIFLAVIGVGAYSHAWFTAKPCKGDSYPVSFSTPKSLLLYKVPLLLPH